MIFSCLLLPYETNKKKTKAKHKCVSRKRAILLHEHEGPSVQAPEGTDRKREEPGEAEDAPYGAGRRAHESESDRRARPPQRQ